MISLFFATNTTFSGNGDVILTPLECTHDQKAAGQYDLTMRHPIDATGKWKNIVPEAVIRAPVPEETIETAYSGMDVDLYRTTTEAALRDGTSEEQAISYSEWSAFGSYSVGSKVSVSGQSHRNYQCNHWDPESGQTQVPPYNNPWWTPIADKTEGSAVLVTLKAGTRLYYVSGPSDGWYLMSTTYDLEGYIKSSQVEFVEHLDPSETQPHKITTQLFRIKTVSIDTKTMTLTATAEHVSYDLNGVLVENANIHRKKPAYALAMIEQEFMIDYRGTIATNLTKNSDGTYTGKIQGKNAMYALLDPDKGIVASFDAMYRRDNWDLYVMRKKNTDRGFRLRYGKNLIGLNWNIKSEGLINRVVPVAKDEDGSDLYLSGTRWVDSDDIGNQPVIRMERIKVDGQVGKDDGSETDTTWTAAALRAEMQKRAEERFTIDKADQIVHEFTVDFEMQGDTEEHKELKKLETVLLYDTVTVTNEEIGLIVDTEVSEIVYDCIREKVTSIKMTNVNSRRSRTVSGFHVFNNSITGDKLTDSAGAEIIGSTKEDAIEGANVYTDDKISSVKSWVNQNFVAK